MIQKYLLHKNTVIMHNPSYTHVHLSIHPYINEYNIFNTPL
jgi:hypothetical protein